MNVREPDQAATVEPEGVPAPPHTGIEQIDQATAGLSGLNEVPLAQHPDRLAGVHDALHRVLHSDHPVPDQAAQHDQALSP
ncbi:MAG: hypothetical protein H0T91_07955 [Propionibacteriaceae bacterium]|nr:hypothetical protein [Propionibacteriaceae bacterium]